MHYLHFDRKICEAKNKYKRERPKWVNNLSIGLGVMRLACYLIFFHPLTTDAQWQLDLITLNIADSQLLSFIGGCLCQ